MNRPPNDVCVPNDISWSVTRGRTFSDTGRASRADGVKRGALAACYSFHKDNDDLFNSMSYGSSVEVASRAKRTLIRPHQSHPKTRTCNDNDGGNEDDDDDYADLTMFLLHGYCNNNDDDGSYQQ